jgi:hypothetical protein
MACTTDGLLQSVLMRECDCMWNVIGDHALYNYSRPLINHCILYFAGFIVTVITRKNYFSVQNDSLTLPSFLWVYSS